MFLSTSRKMAVLALAAGLALPMCSMVRAADQAPGTPGGTDRAGTGTQTGAGATSGSGASGSGATGTRPGTSGNTGADASGTAGTAMGSADNMFIAKAANGNMLEVKLGELAQQKATADDVKKFGQQMTEDHGKANMELKQIAQTKNVTLSSDLMGEEKKTYEKMAALSGMDFDKQFIAGMIKDHKEDIADFEKEAKEGKDAETKAWAAKTLPTLQSHYQMIQQIAQSHGVDMARTAGDKQPGDKQSGTNSQQDRTPQK